MSLPGYDAWLERPYVEAAEAQAAYERFCESRGLDADEDYWNDFYAFMENDGPDPDDARDRALDREWDGVDW